MHIYTLLLLLCWMTVAMTTETPAVCVDEKFKDAADALIFRITPEQRQNLLSSSPEEFASKFNDLIREVRDAFETEGLVVVRGLLDVDLLDRLEKDSQAIVDNSQSKSDRFASVRFGPVFSDTALREVALSSAIPRFVAVVLMGMDWKKDSMYLLKDAFLAKGGEKRCCGWHVDDAGFWPTSARSRPGVNAWIAVDDIPAKHGGGLAVSPRSHRAPWRKRAYEAIGSTQLYPEEGLVPGTPVYEKLMKSKVPGSGYGKTCSLEDEDPELARIIDGTAKVFDFQNGDVLFHTRWIFHRSMPLTSEGEEYFQRKGKEPNLKRYSIRYEHGDSRLLRGMNAEFAVLLNSESKGKTLAEINRDEGPYYPRCWPDPMSEEEMEKVDHLVAEKFPLAERKLTEFFAKMMQGSGAKE